MSAPGGVTHQYDLCQPLALHHDESRVDVWKIAADVADVEILLPVTMERP